MPRQLVDALLRQMDEVVYELPWLDESFDKKLQGVTEQVAFAQPRQDYHSVAEILSHLTVWRTEILSRIRDRGTRRITVNSPENWKTHDELSKLGWEQLKSDFYKSHEALKSFLKEKNDEFLRSSLQGTEKKVFYYLEGLLHHDLYHLGQIGLVLKMLRP